MFRLKTLGGALLEGPDGIATGAIAQRRRLAVLSLLAASGGGVSRDRIVALLWPESDDERARHALAQLLYAVRSDLGPEAVTGGVTALRLDPDVVTSDIAEFHDALARGNLERAVELVGGPFLDGFHLGGCPDFERWVEDERARIARLAEDAVEALAKRAEEAGDPVAALRWWQRLAGFQPYDSRIALALMRAHVAAGDAAGAIRHARTHGALVRSQLETEPDPAIAAYAAELTAAPATLPDPTAPEPRTVHPAHAAVADSVTAPRSPPAAQLPTGRRSRSRLLLATSAACAVALVGIAGLWREPVPETPVRVLIADAETATDDPGLARAVPFALAAGLAQSPAVQVASPERIRQALVYMRMPGADSALDAELALGIARRTGLGAVIVPTVARVGDGYELTARVLDPADGAVLGTVGGGVVGREELLDGIERVARTLRRELGESRRSIARHDVPLPLVTTASLDALEKFAAGARAFGRNQLDEASALWQGAVAIDSGFATAHAALGALNYWVNRPTEAEAHFARALAHVDELPERERVMIRARAESWRGNRAESTRLLSTYLVQHPDDVDALSFLAYDYLRLGRDRDALDIFTRLVAHDSTHPGWFINLATVEKGLGRYAEAIPHYRRAFALAPELETANDNVNLEYGSVYVALGQVDSAAAVFAKLLGDDVPRRARGLRSFALLAMHQGRYAEAATHLSAAIPLNRRSNAPVSEIRNRLLLATALDQQGLGSRATEQRDSAYALIRRTDAEPTLLFWAGKALARAGDAERAAALLESLETYPHPGSAAHVAALEGLRGEVLVARGSAQEALQHLEEALLADSTIHVLESIAQAAAAAGDADRAASLYESLADDFEFGWEAQEHVRSAAYRLGRAEEQRGDREAAARAYERFLEQWKDADGGLVLPIEARARLTALRGGGGR